MNSELPPSEFGPQYILSPEHQTQIKALLES
jgi:hypothetical protein